MALHTVYILTPSYKWQGLVEIVPTLESGDHALKAYEERQFNFVRKANILLVAVYLVLAEPLLRNILQLGICQAEQF